MTFEKKKIHFLREVFLAVALWLPELLISFFNNNQALIDYFAFACINALDARRHIQTRFSGGSIPSDKAGPVHPDPGGLGGPGPPRPLPWIPHCGFKRSRVFLTLLGHQH